MLITLVDKWKYLSGVWMNMKKKSIKRKKMKREKLGQIGKKIMIGNEKEKCWKSNIHEWINDANEHYLI